MMPIIVGIQEGLYNQVDLLKLLPLPVMPYVCIGRGTIGKQKGEYSAISIIRIYQNTLKRILLVYPNTEKVS